MSKPECFNKQEHESKCDECDWFNACDVEAEPALCPNCSGSGEGQTDRSICDKCHGSGVQR